MSEKLSRLDRRAFLLMTGTGSAAALGASLGAVTEAQAEEEDQPRKVGDPQHSEHVTRYYRLARF